MSVEYRVATMGDVFDVALRLRDQDRVEVVAATGNTPGIAMVDAYRSSKRTWAVDIDGRTECIFGIGELSDKYANRIGVPWMLGTPAILKHQKRLIRDARSIVEDMQDSYATLTNYTHASNFVAIRWLTHLGFIFGSPIQINNHTFIPFYRHRNV